MIVNTVIIFGIILALAAGTGFYLFFVKDVNSQTVGSFIFVVIGLIFIAIGSVIALYNYRFVQQAESASAIVISDEKSLVKDSDQKLVEIYVPKVRFTTSRGQVINFNGSSSRFPEYESGERVEVLYLSEQPENARIKSFDWRWFTAAALAVAGIIFIGIALRVAFANPYKPETHKRRGRGL